MSSNGKSIEQYQNEYSHLKKMHESMNSAFHNIENENTKLKIRNEILIEEKKNWVAEKGKQEKLIFETITNSNRKNNEYLEIIQSAQGTRHMLDKKIKELAKENIELKQEIERLKQLTLGE